MKIDEVKFRVKRFIDKTIDLYFMKNDLSGKLMNATAHIYVQQNIYKIDNILQMFGDKNHEIDIDMVMKQYSDILLDGDEFRLNVKEQFGNQLGWLGDILPDRVVLFRKDDIESIFL